MGICRSVLLNYKQSPYENPFQRLSETKMMKRKKGRPPVRAVAEGFLVQGDGPSAGQEDDPGHREGDDSAVSGPELDAAGPDGPRCGRARGERLRVAEQRRDRDVGGAPAEVPGRPMMQKVPYQMVSYYGGAGRGEKIEENMRK